MYKTGILSSIYITPNLLSTHYKKNNFKQN